MYCFTKFDLQECCASDREAWFVPSIDHQASPEMYLDSTFSASKKIISPLGEFRWRDGERTTKRIVDLPAQHSQDDILCDRSTSAPYRRGWNPSLRSGCAFPALRVCLLTKNVTSSCQILSLNLPNRCVNKSCTSPTRTC